MLDLCTVGLQLSINIINTAADISECMTEWYLQEATLNDTLTRPETCNRRLAIKERRHKTWYMTILYIQRQTSDNWWSGYDGEGDDLYSCVNTVKVIETTSHQPHGDRKTMPLAWDSLYYLNMNVDIKQAIKNVQHAWQQKKK